MELERSLRCVGHGWSSEACWRDHLLVLRRIAVERDNDAMVENTGDATFETIQEVPVAAVQPDPNAITAS